MGTIHTNFNPLFTTVHLVLPWKAAAVEKPKSVYRMIYKLVSHYIQHLFYLTLTISAYQNAEANSVLIGHINWVCVFVIVVNKCLINSLIKCSLNSDTDWQLSQQIVKVEKQAASNVEIGRHKNNRRFVYLKSLVITAISCGDKK